VSEAHTKVSRRWLAPEVVQTSSMDCGPAALKCLLEGFHIPVSYGRLREACQTDVDGTSIDTIEVVANQLGMLAEQAIVPADHLFLAGVETLPAVVVVRHGYDEAHFVVVWRKHGNWLQVMDPASGRRWVRVERFVDEMLSHRCRSRSRNGAPGQAARIFYVRYACAWRVRHDAGGHRAKAERGSHGQLVLAGHSTPSCA
jgi:ABC-type bacteriocin/lantibiotic exporter with double-glycine peptidase domain